MKFIVAASWCVLAATPVLAQTPAPAQQPPAGQTTPSAPTPDAWLPRPGFSLQALDKVTTRSLAVTGRVGETVKYGSLSITVRSCLVRPPDQALDAAAYLDIVDAHPGMPRFSGWMMLSAPGVSMLEHPVYDIRLTSCLP